MNVAAAGIGTGGRVQDGPMKRIVDTDGDSKKIGKTHKQGIIGGIGGALAGAAVGGAVGGIGGALVGAQLSTKVGRKVAAGVVAGAAGTAGKAAAVGAAIGGATLLGGAGIGIGLGLGVLGSKISDLFKNFDPRQIGTGDWGQLDRYKKSVG